MCEPHLSAMASYFSLSSSKEASLNVTVQSLTSPPPFHPFQEERHSSEVLLIQQF